MTVRFLTNRKYRDLTPGNVYRVIGIEAGDFRIMNDDGRPYLYPPKLFEVIDASEPAEWRVTTGQSGERYAYPPQLAGPGFFEAYFDGDRAAMATLHGYLSTLHERQRTRRRAAS